MNEKIFKTLGQIGAAGIIVGIITTIVGITAGVISIVSGARALKLKGKQHYQNDGHSHTVDLDLLKYIRYGDSGVYLMY